MDLLDEIDTLLGVGKVFFLDTNLNSPVLTTEIQETKNLINSLVLKTVNRELYFSTTNYSTQHKVTHLQKLCVHNRWSVRDLKQTKFLPPGLYPQLERASLHHSLSSKLGLVYDDAQVAAQELEESLCEGLKTRGLPVEEIKGTARSLNSPTISSYRYTYEKYCNFFGRAESRVKTSPDTWTKGIIGEVDFWVNSSCALIQLDGVLYHSSLNQVLMLKDKLSTRYMMLEHVEALGLPASLRSKLLELFKWQDQVLIAYNNESYNLLKAVEPMFKTWLSHKVDNIFGADTAYTRMKIKMETKEDKVCKTLGVVNLKLMNGLYALVESIHDVRSIVEMFGCLKTCGHPLIDADLGGASASAEALTPDQTSLVDAQELRNTFCHIVLTSYIRIHGSWPRLFHARKNTKLKRLNDIQYRDISRSSYPLSDWNTTEWTKLFDFDYFPNFLELMDDKSISLYRSEKHLSWDKTSKPTSNRRLLIELLTRKKVSVEKIVQRVSNRDIPHDWLIVSLYPKEREFKIEPRMFAMLVLEMRCFFTAVEANIADNLFKYMPQQTMTKSKTQNQERFLKFTDPSKNRIDYTLFLEIDLTRWNLRWRELVIHMLGHDLNCMFGVKGTFTVTHWFFRMAQIVVRVAGLRPEGIEKQEPPLSNLAWRDHLGGFEGLNQKLWTAATYSMVEMALSPLVEKRIIADYEVIGQGDNQVVRVSIPNNNRLREDIIPEVRDIINQRLESTCASVNQEVKPEENIESTAVLTYSKDVLVSGVEYPTSLKKHSRLFPVTSLDFPSVTSNTRAILAGAVAGGENALYPLRSAIIGHYHAYRYLKAASQGFSVHGKTFPSLSHQAIQAALVLPPSIGGLCGQAYASYFYKGGSDPLGKEISGLRFIGECDNTVSKLASRALRGLEERYYISVSPNLETLIDNPYALPLSTPPSALSKAGQLTLAAFKGKVKNTDIKVLLNSSVEKSERSLRQDLIRMRPMNPLLLHDLFEASGFGSIKLLRKMFVHTRTVQTVAQASNPLITHVFLRSDLNEVTSFCEWLKGLPNSSYSGRNSYDLVSQFRSYWGLDLHGVTTQQPLDFFHSSGESISGSGIRWSAHTSANLLNVRGPLTGYIGTLTREKRSDHGYKIVDTGIPSRSLMKLQLIRSQAYGNSEFNKLLDEISLTRTPVPLSRVTEVLPKVIGGSISHRYASSVRNMGASYVGPLNFATHIRVDTDNINKVSGSALNYPIMIQEFIIMTQAGAKLLHLHRQAQNGLMKLPFNELLPLIDEPISCGEVNFKHGTLPRSILSFSSTLSLRRSVENEIGMIPRGCIIPPQLYLSERIILESVTNFFISTLRDQNRAKLIADTRGYASIPSNFRLDIAEAHSLGITRLLNCVARAILYITIRDTFRTIQLHPDRWDESMFLTHNIRVCIKILGNYMSHPLFAAHKDFEKLRFSQLKYSASFSLSDRAVAYVRRLICTIFSSPDHPFWKGEVSVFAGDGPSVVNEAITTSAAIKVYRLFVIGDPQSTVYARMLSGYMRVTHNQQRTPKDVLDTLRLRCLQLGIALKKLGDPLLGTEISGLSQLRGVKVFNDDQKTVMRNARLLSAHPLPVSKSKLGVTTLPDVISGSHCTRCLPEPKSITDVIWTKNKLRPHGGHGTAGYTWIPLLPKFRIMKSTVIIGNGNGGLADLILSCYNTQVLGLDLEKDMPSSSATLLNYIPVCIQPQNRARFLQSDFSINTSGDWTDGKIRTRFLDNLQEISTIFVDITSQISGELTEALKDTADHRIVDEVLARIMGPHTDIFRALDQLNKHYFLEWWVLSNTHVEVEVVVRITNRKVSHKCSDLKSVALIPLPELCHTTIPERWDELLESATLSSFSWDSEPLSQAAVIMNNLCRSLLNKKKEVRMVYKDRYSLILGYATLYAATDPEPSKLVQSWISDDEIETDLFVYKANQKSITHLLRYVPRLLSYTSRSPLYT